MSITKESINTLEASDSVKEQVSKLFESYSQLVKDDNILIEKIKSLKTEKDNIVSDLNYDRDKVAKLQIENDSLNYRLSIQDKSITELSDTISILKQQLADSIEKYRVLAQRTGINV